MAQKSVCHLTPYPFLKFYIATINRFRVMGKQLKFGIISLTPEKLSLWTAALERSLTLTCTGGGPLRPPEIYKTKRCITTTVWGCMEAIPVYIRANFHWSKSKLISLMSNEIIKVKIWPCRGTMRKFHNYAKKRNTIKAYQGQIEKVLSLSWMFEVKVIHGHRPEVRV